MIKKKEVQNTPMAVFDSTLYKFVDKAKSSRYFAHAFLLYFFYYKEAKRRDKNSIWATIGFTREGTGLSVRQLAGARKLLLDMGLITNYKYVKELKRSFFYVKVSLRDDLFADLETLDTPYTNCTVPPDIQNVCANSISRRKDNNLKTTTTKSSKEDLHPSGVSSKKKVFKSKFTKPVQKESPNPVYKKIVKPVPKEDDLGLGRKYKKIPVGPAPKSPPPPKPVRRSEVDDMSADGFKRTELTPHVYLLKDKQLYNALVLLGATNHKKSRAYTQTMNMIHELLSPDFENPYNISNRVTDYYKGKVWTQEEVIESFKFYLKNSNGKTNVISSFICQNIPGVPPFSPLVVNHNRMMKTSTDTLEGDVKLLSDHLEGMRVGGVLDALQLKKVVSLIGVYCNGYKPKRGLEYMHGGNVIGVFTNYIQDKLRIASFKIGYIQGEKFIEEFVEESLKTGNLTY